MNQAGTDFFCRSEKEVPVISDEVRDRFQRVFIRGVYQELFHRAVLTEEQLNDLLRKQDKME